MTQTELPTHDQPVPTSASPGHGAMRRVSELRKLTTTRMPLAFLAVLTSLAVINGIAVAVGTDMDGSKTFISTAFDQQSLIAFAANALMIAGLFGAGLTGLAVTIGLQMTDFGFMITSGGLARVLAASMLAGAAGAVLGAGIGSVIRNTGGVVTGTVVVLVISPPVIVQLASGTAPWLPNSLALTASGVAEGTSAAGASVAGAVVAMVLWALIPALIALWTVQHHDVV